MKNVVKLSRVLEEQKELKDSPTLGLKGPIDNQFLTSEERVRRENRLRELIESERGKKILMKWEIEVLFGWSNTLKRKSYAIKLTDREDFQSITFLKHEIQDMKNTEKIVKTLTIIGEVDRNYIRFFGDYINAARSLKDKVTMVDDLSLIVSEQDSELGFSVVDYYKLIISDYFKNKEQYPTWRSNKYITDVNHGVILDADNNEYHKNEYGFYPVAIRSGKLKQLLPRMSDQEGREVIRKFAYLGVLHDSIARRVERDAKRFNRRIKMVERVLNSDENEKDFSDNVYILQIVPSLL